MEFISVTGKNHGFCLLKKKKTKCITNETRKSLILVSLLLTTGPRISNLVVNNFLVPFPEIMGTLQ